MANISEKEFDKLADLAKLQFNDTEKTALINDLHNILNFCEQLNKVDTSGIQPLIYMNDDTNVVREDVVQGMINKQEALAIAPASDSDFFRVSKVLKPKTK